MTSSDHVTDDVMGGVRGGSFDLSEIRHYSDTDGVLLVDQSAMLRHEFSPPSPAPQDVHSYNTPRSANIDRYRLSVCLSVCHNLEQSFTVLS